MKNIKAYNYFLDVGLLSILSILGFSLGISKWVGVIGIGVYTMTLIMGTVYLENKRCRNIKRK